MKKKEQENTITKKKKTLNEDKKSSTVSSKKKTTVNANKFTKKALRKKSDTKEKVVNKKKIKHRSNLTKKEVKSISKKGTKRSTSKSKEEKKKEISAPIIDSDNNENKKASLKKGGYGIQLPKDIQDSVDELLLETDEKNPISLDKIITGITSVEAISTKNVKDILTYVQKKGFIVADVDMEEKGDNSTNVTDEVEDTINDPVRLYLREIGRKKLLNAEDEINLAREMREREQRVVKIIKSSGLFLLELNNIMISMKKNKDNDTESDALHKSENDEFDSNIEIKRLSQLYKSIINQIESPLTQYLSLKKKAYMNGENFFDDPIIVKLRDTIFKKIKKVEIDASEIQRITDVFFSILKTIEGYKKRKQNICNLFQVRDASEVRHFGASFNYSRSKKRSFSKT